MNTLETAKPADSIGEPAGSGSDTKEKILSTTNYKPISSQMSIVEKAAWLHSDLVSFYLDRCAASLGDGPTYLKSFDRLQLALECTDSLLKFLNRLLWGAADNG